MTYPASGREREGRVSLVVVVVCAWFVWMASFASCKKIHYSYW